MSKAHTAYTCIYIIVNDPMKMRNLKHSKQENSLIYVLNNE